MTEEVSAPKLYPQDDINAFANGVAMDLRVRLAIEKNQAKRLGAFQVYQQVGSQQAAQEEQSRVVPAAPLVDRSKH